MWLFRFLKENFYGKRFSTSGLTLDWSNSWWTTTGSPSSKYEHRRASALLRNIQNIRICMGKKTYRFCNLRKWKDFNKTQLTLLKICVTSLLRGPRAYLWPFYRFLCKRFSLYIKVTLIYNWNLSGSVIIERYLVFQHLAATWGEKRPES